MSALLGVPVGAAYHLVYTLTGLLTPVLGSVAAVAAIVVGTAAARLLVTPLTFRALRGQAAQARLAPQIQRLRQRHGHQPERFSQELTALYQREGTSPFAGFAPLLAQWPVFSVLYLLFRSPTVAGGPNLLLSRTLLGAPLGDHWLSEAGAFSAHGAVFIGVLAVLTAACWLVARAARRLLPRTAPTGVVPARTVPARTVPARTVPARTVPARTVPASTTPAGTGTGLAAPDGTGASTALAVVGRVAPYITVVIAAFAPLAAVIYLVTSTGWSAAERLVFAARADRSRAAASGSRAQAERRPA